MSSYWSQTGKIEVRLSDGTIRKYFIKLSEAPIGLLMVEGEFESMAALHAVVPDMTPKPYGWGTYESQPNLHWFLCEFLDMHEPATVRPPVVEFCRRIADMHQRSQAMSTTGQFGFHVKTPAGYIIQRNEWRKSWEEYFTDRLRCALDQEIANAGSSPEYDELWTAMFAKVIPRLLRPLETGGNVTKPSLCHGDLWYGNTAVRADPVGPPLIFDAAAMWAHNEYDLRCFGPGADYNFSADYTTEYFKNCPPAEPKEDVTDRLLLYSITAAVGMSLLFPKAPKFRQRVVDTARALVKKYPDGYVGPHARKGAEHQPENHEEKVKDRSDSVQHAQRESTASELL